MSFNAFGKNKILAKIPEFTVNEPADLIQNCEKLRPFSHDINCLCSALKLSLRNCTTERGEQWLSGRVLDSRLRGCRFEPHWRLCIVFLSKTLYPLFRIGSTQEDPS